MLLFSVDCNMEFVQRNGEVWIMKEVLLSTEGSDSHLFVRVV